MLKITVTDTGIGILPQDKKKLFKLFGFVENRKDKEANKNGVGLGLVIADLIVNEFDGKIIFDSEPE